MTKGAVYVAIAAAIGNMLQGWDNATIAGAVLYIKKEFHLETQPTIEGLIVAMSLIGATVITTFSGSVSDAIGRRPMLVISSMFYFVSGLVMFWSPNVYVLLVARLLDGFGIGLAVTLVPLYISETAPSDIRGLLNTLPQFTGSIGMCLAYTMVFFMSLKSDASWRMMLGVLSLPSIAYFILAVFFLPESPRWLVSKGKMEEAKLVLQALRGKEDVSGEMALLVEGLEVGGETSVEEYVINADNELSEDHVEEKDEIKLYGAEEGQSWVAKPVRGQSSLVLASRQGSMAAHMIDPMVTLFGSVHEKQNDTGSMVFPNFGSMFHGEQHKPDNWDVESNHDKGNLSGDESDDNNLKSPLLSRNSTGVDKDMIAPIAKSSMLNARQPSETTNAMGIGGGWQLAYRKTEDGRKAGGLQRIYLHQEGGADNKRGSMASPTGGAGDGDAVRASALVSRSVLCLDAATGQNPIQSGLIKPPTSSTKQGTSWSDLAEPGVKQALIVGVGIQILQQFSGINGVLYYTPQILEQAGVGLLLANMGIGSESASFLISGVTTLLMLPSIGVAMKLIDVAGRRALLLRTLPVLIASLIVLVLSNTIHLGSVVHAVVSTISVIVYFCTFVMGYGPIPNTLCSEIFPTRVRGLCIAICALTFWIGDIIVTYTLPVLLTTIGLAGAFGIYAIVCTISWFFVYFRVPETKGMPLEVITEFFAMGAANKKAN